MQKIKYKIFHMEIYKYTPHGFPDMKEEVQKMFLSMIIFYLKIRQIATCNIRKLTNVTYKGIFSMSSVKSGS